MFGITGKYRLEQRLGGGGMAEVFLGSATGAEGFSRKVAIKRVLPALSDNPAFAQMFISEARISARLVHPNIVTVIDFDRDRDNQLFLVMELVEGRDLDALVETGALPYPVIIFIITEILRGLGHAHHLPNDGARGLVHRDVSPHNILVSWDGSVKISDFGIAKARATTVATASAFIKGKPAYMSPEQARGDSLDGRSDLFAVGVMLWEMLVGKRLFVAGDTQSTLAAVLYAPIARPRLLRSTVPKDLERVTLKLLERNVEHRYATAGAAIDDLLACSDAPKAGREMLMQTLVERYPREAPPRPSSARPRPRSTQPAVHSPAQDAQRLSAVMSARTGTSHRMVRTPRKLRLPLPAVAVLVALAVAVAAAMALRSTQAWNPASTKTDAVRKDAQLSSVPASGRSN